MDKDKKTEKDKLIKQEIAELARNTKDIPAEKKPYAERLIKQAAFMYATLLELQTIINEDGAVEMFEQGAQKMLREHPASKTYNAMIKNYSTYIKQLAEMTPQGTQAKSELGKFLAKRKT